MPAHPRLDDYLVGLEWLSRVGTTVWPNILGSVAAQRKSVLNYLLAGTMETYGGFVERPEIITDVQQGKALLRSGKFVIKRDLSAMGKNVFIPATCMDPLSDPENVQAQIAFETAWMETRYTNPTYRPAWLALSTNRFLHTHGEVRCYFSWGRLMDMWYTEPVPYRAHEFDFGRATGALNPLKDIT